VRTLEAFDALLGGDPSPGALRQEILARFDVYRSVGWNGKGDVQFTGYYTPVFDARRAPSSAYRYPLYRRPPDLVLQDGVPHGRRRPDGTIEPYPARREIEGGGILAGKGLELAWLRDPFDAYIVHVQGSAILRLEDGSELRVGYHGKTDRPYRSVADALLSDGRITPKQRSLQGLRAHFRAHPEDLPYLNRNESYIFFTESRGGPLGSLNEMVTPYVTVALDAGVFPRAAGAYVDTRIPAAGAAPSAARAGPPALRTFRAFMLNQDTGGAIRSAGRADLYLGIGPEAEAVAGHAQEEGRLYFLLLRE
jgi:membrane-bound lytic murein transglycosylase A